MNSRVLMYEISMKYKLCSIFHFIFVLSWILQSIYYRFCFINISNLFHIVLWMLDYGFLYMNYLQLWFDMWIIWIQILYFVTAEKYSHMRIFFSFVYVKVEVLWKWSARTAVSQIFVRKKRFLGSSSYKWLH